MVNDDDCQSRGYSFPGHWLTLLTHGCREPDVHILADSLQHLDSFARAHLVADLLDITPNRGYAREHFYRCALSFLHNTLPATGGFPDLRGLLQLANDREPTELRWDLATGKAHVRGMVTRLMDAPDGNLLAVHRRVYQLVTSLARLDAPPK